MCCRGEVLVREDGLFFNRSCCTLDQWLKSEVLSRGEVLWLEDEGEAENEGDEDEMLRMKNEEKEDVFTDENEALWQEDEGKAENEELYEMSPRVGFQGEGGLVEGMEVQSFLMDQGANRQTNEEHQSSKVMTMSPEILPSTDNKQKSTVVVQNTRTNSWPNGSSGHQDEEDGAADVVGDIEDKLEEVEEEQRSIRERVHRVNSWNEVHKNDNGLLSLVCKMVVSLQNEQIGVRVPLFHENLPSQVFRVLVVSLLAIVIILLVSLLCRFTHSCCGKRSSET